MNGVFEKKTPSLLQGIRFISFHGYPPMFHTHAELIYVSRGSIQTTVDGENHTLSAGELCVLFPYLTHTYGASPEAEGLILLFDPGVTAFTNTLLTKRPTHHYTDGRFLAPLLDRAVTMLKNENPKTATGYLNAILGELLEVLPLEDAPDATGNMAIRVLEYCADHFQRPITLKTVADALFISQSYVSKIFSHKLRYSFREYINALRIDQAKRLLQETDQPITDVIFACGFNNQSSFNRVFRKLCGVSPKDYKKKFH